MTAWPHDVLIRYRTVGDALVDVRDKGSSYHLRYAMTCGGCLEEADRSVLYSVREQAQLHAEKCRAMPRPALSS